MPDPKLTFAENENRRRSPRFGCTGLANIVSLPSDGMLLQGMIRNVSRGGCFVETGLVLPCGTLTEILARVDNSCFRALGQVKTVRDRSGVGIEFVRLSSGAQHMLAELVEYLERAQPPAKVAAAVEDEPLEHEKSVIAENFPILRTFMPGKTSQTLALVTDPDQQIIEARFVNDPLDLFA